MSSISFQTEIRKLENDVNEVQAKIRELNNISSGQPSSGFTSRHHDLRSEISTKAFEIFNTMNTLSQSNLSTNQQARVSTLKETLLASGKETIKITNRYPWATLISKPRSLQSMQTHANKTSLGETRSVSLLDSAKHFLSAIASKISAAAGSVWASIAEWWMLSNDTSIVATFKRLSGNKQDFEITLTSVTYTIPTSRGESHQPETVLSNFMNTKNKSVLLVNSQSPARKRWLAFKASDTKVNGNYNLIVVDLQSGEVRYSKGNYGLQTIQKGELASLLSGKGSETAPTKILATLNKELRIDCLKLFKDALTSAG